MLQITLEPLEMYNGQTDELFTIPAETLNLEHSLASLSKWEAKHEKPFLGKDDKSVEEIISYIECMIVDGETPPQLPARVKQEHVDALGAYMHAKQSATWFTDEPSGGPGRETITAEVIYYWMTVFNIDWQAQYWHLNRLLTLVRVCGAKNEKPKKLGRAAAAQQRADLNAKRKQELGTPG